MYFEEVLEKYRKTAFSQADKGRKFEKLIQAYLKTDSKFKNLLDKVWLWSDFYAKRNFSGQDTGIDLVAKTYDGKYWAIQCKFFAKDGYISKSDVDTFISTSGKTFLDENNLTTNFSFRLWVDTTQSVFSQNAEDTFLNQIIPVGRLSYDDLKKSPIDWRKLDEGITGEKALTPKKILRPHQSEAVNRTNEYFKQYDRGKLIMACGTGKTFTALRIAEKETAGNGFVLFLVPSIALLGQTLNEWYADANVPLNAVCICSDPDVSKKKSKNEDIDMTSVVDLALPASTNVKNIIEQFDYIENKENSGMTVVFSTYQSIDVIAKAQKELAKNDDKFAEFDLIICDEAHRTTGVKLTDDDESAFIKVHNNDFIRAKKRLYMTATPRLYTETAKSKAKESDVILCSMDDENLYGEEIYRIGFGEAVEKNLLTDYKVLILTLNEKNISPSIQKMLAGEEIEVEIDDISKLIGCINALSKQIIGDDGSIKESDDKIMKRAVAFCQSIRVSKKITEVFNATSQVYINDLPEEKRKSMVNLESKHIDGTMGVSQRNSLLDWLKEDTPQNESRVLTNVRCLSEGVDVPSLDAVLFLSARNSQVDVVQSVGRVMRKSEGKKYGYIIIPIVVKSDTEPEKALDDNKKYQVVWTVLNALRAHDDRFNATINKIELNEKKPSQILIGTPDTEFDEEGNSYDSDSNSKIDKEVAEQLNLQFKDLQSVVFARMVQKVGDRRYWEDWAKSVAEIATRQIDRITKLVNDNAKHQEEFDKFLTGLHQNINPYISKDEAIEMLSQHIITKPVFDALFENYSFVKNNSISQSMQKILDLLEGKALEKDLETLQKFYDSVRTRASGIDNSAGKQRIIIELYDKFFKTAFPKMVERLGIVYTPIEVVDFIIHSVNDILYKEFGRTLSDENVNILDPFTGTGTFITRLLQSGIIKKEDLERKYKNEIFANEIVLLAYYIAAVNIENAYHDISENNEYHSFEGICLTDTFQLSETDEKNKLSSDVFLKNSERVIRQKNTPIKVIIGNPPYSAGQKSRNDNAQNQSYPKLEKRITDTYANNVQINNISKLYDSYIKAFRWSSDRLKQVEGILCFVTNANWLNSETTTGFRKSIEKEFNKIYVFDLRGNQRTSGELSRKEGGKIFGSGSRTPISITLLVKNKKVNTKDNKAEIYYSDIGDYLNREEKLKIISDYKSFANENLPLIKLEPNEQGDWINQRNEEFENLINLYDDDNRSTFFRIKTIGIQTINETIYNSNKSKLDCSDLNLVKTALYRPFYKQYFCKIRENIYRPGKWDNLLIDKNLFICNTGKIGTSDFSVLISAHYSDYQIQKNAQIFPLYYYEEISGTNPTLMSVLEEEKYERRDGISDYILEKARKQYGIKGGRSQRINKEDIFYYVYGFLHSKNYREKYANDLKKMLPRIPLVDEVSDFWAFSDAGRELADLHLNYENVKGNYGVVYSIDLPKTSHLLKSLSQEEVDYINYKVVKMRFPSKDQKDTIIYNEQIKIENIPLRAYDYIVNGKSAIEWVMERYQITTHKDSGITNDPNDWSREQNDPKYIFNLLLSVINLSIRTVEIVNGLPKV